ncbi:MAG: hypothetical protein IIB82_02330 [Bacteroidetes bacterium]|nr:hypothetical protein [Bacteroidota bacterium]
MNPIQKIKTSNFWIRLTHWEFWPFEVVYIPIFIYWLWLSLRARSLFFFTASNPGIMYGGMLGESKYEILMGLPVTLIPKTVIANNHITLPAALDMMKHHNLRFPIILKPDIGERGWQVEKIANENELEAYLNANNVDILFQEYIDLPLELGILYYRFPDKKTGRITSVVKKKMLEITGNGSSTIKELMYSIPRAKLQIETFEKDQPEVLANVPASGEKIELMPIGNHCRGTTFLNANDLITKELTAVFDAVSDKIDGFYFGRFDIRCESKEALYNGKMKIMELNGAGSEPGHIYHPGARLIDAYKSLFSHWKALFLISRMNNKRGIPYLSFVEGLRVIKKLRDYNKLKVKTLNLNV